MTADCKASLQPLKIIILGYTTEFTGFYVSDLIGFTLLVVLVFNVLNMTKFYTEPQNSVVCHQATTQAVAALAVQTRASYYQCFIDGLFPNGSVSVFNAERLKTPDGEASVIYGYAYRANPKEEGKFTVRLQGKLSAPCEHMM